MQQTMIHSLITSILMNTDSYKPSHYLQYPPNTETIFSYIEARGGVYKEAMMFSLQYIVKEYLTKPITQKEIDFAAKIWAAHGEPFNREGWEYILEKYDGYLPIRIRAIPEGMVIPVKNALVTVENTDPKVYWLTSYIETMLLRIWYGITVATQSYTIKQVIKKYMEVTCDTMDKLPFMLHDFGSRGVSSLESAMIGGAAHLGNFMGSDNISGALMAMEFYGAGLENFTPEQMVAFSIPAAEHSSITSWTKEGEVEAYRNMIKQFGKPGALFACVSDSYDIFNTVKNQWGKELKEEVLACGGTLVIRPDSGDPTTIVTQIVKELDYAFGSTKNSKGFKVLNPAVRVIQGDGINMQSIESILFSLKVNGYAAENVAFGMGGALLQILNRDTMQFAMKCSAALVDGTWVDVFKDPITDSGKKSKKGRIETFRNKETGEITTLRLDEVNLDLWEPLMRTVFENGKLLIDEEFAVVRGRQLA